MLLPEQGLESSAFFHRNLNGVGVIIKASRMEVKFLKLSQLLDPKKKRKKELSLCNYALRTTQSCLKPAPISASKQEIMFTVNSAERITGSFFFQIQYKNKVGEREKTLLLNYTFPFPISF